MLSVEFDNVYCFFFDYVYVMDAAGNQLGIYCGTSVPSTGLLVSGTQFSVVFSSDKTDQGMGFALNYMPQLCPGATTLPAATSTIITVANLISTPPTSQRASASTTWYFYFDGNGTNITNSSYTNTTFSSVKATTIRTNITNSTSTTSYSTTTIGEN